MAPVKRPPAQRSPRRRHSVDSITLATPLAADNLHPLYLSSTAGASPPHAGVTQLAEYELSKLDVEGSTPFTRSEVKRSERQSGLPAHVGHTHLTGLRLVRRAIIL